MSTLHLRVKKLAQKGQGSIEYIGIAVIAAIVIAGIVATPIKSLISDGMAKVICQVTHGVDHYSAEGTSPTPPLVATVSTPASAEVLAGECPLVSGKTDSKSTAEAKSAQGKSSDSKKSDKNSEKSSNKNSGKSKDSGKSSGSKSDSQKDGKDSSKSGKKENPVKGEPADVSPQGFDGPFVKGKDGYVYDGEGNRVPYSNSKRRPSYADGQVEEVWKQSRDKQLEEIKNGKLKPDENGFVPKKLEKDEIYVKDIDDNWRSVKWKPGQNRGGKWDMGHKTGHEFRKTHSDYMNGNISKDEFLKEYTDPNNYKVEDPKRNQSHIDEDKSDQ
ncbi:HNH/ENDO VII family nuclease [Brevibacterium sp. UMB10442]|uniref:HNH/ENDO VII family nuclease n=1 Tax=Brevibacterium sp. UMB1308A TaxID=3050608 RepID=UPI00254EDBC1|nr:HNH/ENDO VII family nuclease [Brevibacterium sp. UMB1308A]MDK7750738.1 HNH/ENDO VII family nuclease [Brevibacterium sp. UMB10442]MDK8346256.1 HNH/ENDO VII family nuclease [Brevibacterium sp. UMB1308B]MDK8712504.1 HNH/ENDO VII family nuclease [Brevibacterium sp. UMB1308A]